MVKACCKDIIWGLGSQEPQERRYRTPWIGMFPLLLAVLDRDENRGHYTPYY